MEIFTLDSRRFHSRNLDARISDVFLGQCQISYQVIELLLRNEMWFPISFRYSVFVIIKVMGLSSNNPFFIFWGTRRLYGLGWLRNWVLLIIWHRFQCWITVWVADFFLRFCWESRYVRHAEIAVLKVISWLPPYHRDTEGHRRLLSNQPFDQSTVASYANHVRSPVSLLIINFTPKIVLVGNLQPLCDISSVAFLG